MENRILLLACTLLLSIFAKAQNIHGTITDSNGEPVYGAYVTAMSSDSTIIGRTASDIDGHFSIDSSVSNYILTVSHLAYNNYKKDYTTSDCGTIVLTENSKTLGDVVVKAKAPIVKMENGAMSYDMQTLLRETTATNVYDAVTRVPGVLEQNEALTLVGAGNATLLINGKKSSMTTDQITQLLKNMPASKLKKAIVMTSAPAKYRVKGAAINLIIDSKDANLDKYFNGIAGIGFRQSDYSGGQGNVDLSFGNKQLSADIMYSADYNKKKTESDFNSHHTIDGTLHDIEQDNSGYKRSLTHDFRTSLDYTTKKGDKFDVAYTLQWTPNIKNVEHSFGNYSLSNNIKEGHDMMHNISGEWTSHFGTSAGVDFTYYENPSTQNFVDPSETNNLSFFAKQKQSIRRWNAHIDQEHSISDNFSINYGISGQWALEHSSQDYTNASSDNLVNSYARVDEQTYNAYVGIEGSIGESFSYSLSYAGERYKLNDYKRWLFYPSAELTWQIAEGHTLQASYSMERTYPNYWTLQNSISYLNGYTLIEGNPSLRPIRDYTVGLTYVLRNTYIFNVYYERANDYFAQLAYQMPSQLNLLYQTVNYDYEATYGADFILPVSVGNFWKSRLTVEGAFVKDVDDNFHDISFDKTKFRLTALLNNTFHISSKPDIRAEVNGMFRSPSIQGIYNVKSIWKVDGGLKWLFDNKNAELSLKATNIFNSYKGRIWVNENGQNYEMTTYMQRPEVMLSFTYKFGGYKKKEYKKVDTSRFGLQ